MTGAGQRMNSETSKEPVLQIENLEVDFDTPSGTLHAVRGVSLALHPGEILAVVGESGCGKSVLCRAVMKLLPERARLRGRILAAGEDICAYSERQMQRLRGEFFSMMFQDPMTSLNPAMPVGRQITEALRRRGVSGSEADCRAVELLRLVGIDRPEQRMKLQPHCFSGGMRQRCVLAVALALDPLVLFADEPTTALDVTVQAHILDLLREVSASRGTAIVLITHDLSVVARVADRVAIMYAGKIVETGSAEDIFYDPRHPYTWGLLQALPSRARRGERLRGIPGMPPDMTHLPRGDAFAERNEYALDIDYEEMPPFFPVSAGHSAATWLLDPRAPRVACPVRGRGR